MTVEMPPQETLLATLVGNGREPSLCKHVWNSGWSLIDETCRQGIFVSRQSHPIFPNYYQFTIFFVKRYNYHGIRRIEFAGNAFGDLLP